MLAVDVSDQRYLVHALELMTSCSSTGPVSVLAMRCACINDLVTRHVHQIDESKSRHLGGPCGPGHLVSSDTQQTVEAAAIASGAAIDAALLSGWYQTTSCFQGYWVQILRCPESSTIMQLKTFQA